MAEDYDRFSVVVLGIIAEIDELISQQLDRVLASDGLRELHGRWLALWSLVDLDIDHRQVHLKVMHCTWEELSNDLNRSVDVERTWLYDRIGRKELNTPGGLPFGLLLADYFPSSSPGGVLASGDDLYTLQMLACAGAMALCPVVSSIRDDFFGSPDDRLLVSVGRLERVMHSEDFHSWQLLRKTQEASFLGVAWPMLLYHREYRELTGFCYHGQLSALPLTIGAGWAFACIVMREYDRCHWFGFLRHCDTDSHGGGCVFPGKRVSQGNVFSRAVASIRLSEYLESTYHQLGFLVAGSRYLSDTLVFHNNNSVMACSQQSDEQVLGLLQSTLIGCRFAHYLKLLVRERIGSFDSLRDCELYLSQWLQQYVSDVDYGDDTIMARFPLKQARVQLEHYSSGSHKDSGQYRCVVYLQPQYQYDQMNSEIIVHTDIASDTVSSHNNGRGL